MRGLLPAASRVSTEDLSFLYPELGRRRRPGFGAGASGEVPGGGIEEAALFARPKMAGPAQAALFRALRASVSRWGRMPPLGPEHPWRCPCRAALRLRWRGGPGLREERRSARAGGPGLRGSGASG
ncbi:PREDICTED: uncharacterized protein LOC108524992, partial [Rhinopithecus bieti]|uniref:uncharacterized protein LOC108524992 n=1 Tax=Rhinopithecus bieti TaxID=61621 RepID=UPI00083C68A4